MNLIAGSGWVANLMDPDDLSSHFLRFFTRIGVKCSSQYESFEILEFGKLFWREGF